MSIHFLVAPSFLQFLWPEYGTSEENKQFGDALDVHRMHFGGINWSIPGLCTCCSTRATRATSMLPWSDGRLKHFSYNANVEWINGRFMIF